MNGFCFPSFPIKVRVCVRAVVPHIPSVGVWVTRQCLYCGYFFMNLQVEVVSAEMILTI